MAAAPGNRVPPLCACGSGHAARCATSWSLLLLQARAEDGLRVCLPLTAAWLQLQMYPAPLQCSSMSCPYARQSTLRSMAASMACQSGETCLRLTLVSSVRCPGTGCTVMESLLVAGSHQSMPSAADTLGVRLLCKDPEPSISSEQLPEPRFAHGAATLPSSTQPFGKVGTQWPAPAVCSCM